MSEEPASVPAPSMSEAPPSSSGVMEHKFYDSAPSTAPPSLAPPIEAPARRRGARPIAKVLFAVLFGAVVTLLGYAVKQQLSRADAASPAWLSSAASIQER